jgi:hypothetical protein
MSELRKAMAPTKPAITPDLLRRVGEALYGERWQSALAADLNIADRSMRYWLAGRSPIPPAVRDEVRGLLQANQAEIGALLRELEQEETGK